MDKGEIVEQGSHEKLLEKQGKYYRLWEMQQGNFKVENEEECNEAQIEVEAVEEEGIMSYT